MPETPEAAADDTAVRDRIAEALAQHWPTHMSRNAEHHYRQILAAADAVMPVVQAALAEQERRATTAERAARVFCDQRDDARSDAASAWQNAEDWHEVAQAKDRRAEQAEELLREFVSDTPCDPHPGNGFCQTHGERKPCPQAQAKALLAALDRPEGTQHDTDIRWEIGKGGLQ